MLPSDDMPLRPLGSVGKPDTAAGLITAMEKPWHIQTIRTIRHYGTKNKRVHFEYFGITCRGITSLTCLVSQLCAV